MVITPHLQSSVLRTMTLHIKVVRGREDNHFLLNVVSEMNDNWVFKGDKYNESFVIMIGNIISLTS